VRELYSWLDGVSPYHFFTRIEQ